MDINTQASLDRGNTNNLAFSEIEFEMSGLRAQHVNYSYKSDDEPLGGDGYSDHLYESLPGPVATTIRHQFEEQEKKSRQNSPVLKATQHVKERNPKKKTNLNYERILKNGYTRSRLSDSICSDFGPPSLSSSQGRAFRFKQTKLLWLLNFVFHLTLSLTIVLLVVGLIPIHSCMKDQGTNILIYKANNFDRTPPVIYTVQLPSFFFFMTIVVKKVKNLRFER